MTAGPDIDPLRAPGGARRFSHEAMATVFQVYVAHPDERYASQAAHAAFGVVDRLEREMSRFAANSDVTRINNLAAGESTRVSASTLECLQIARHVFDITGGAFDISIGTGLPRLDLDPELSVVRAATDGVRIDLGGIGKGYAVDLMAELLEEWDLAASLVHGGFSSVLALDAPAGGDGWPLTLSDPGDPSRVLKRLTLCQTALGASGVRKGDHIVDPRTRAAVRDRLAAWAAVPRPDWEPGAGERRPALDARPRAAAVADALTTAAMVLEVDQIEGLCQKHPGLEVWILPKGPADPNWEAGMLHFGNAAD